MNIIGGVSLNILSLRFVNTLYLFTFIISLFLFTRNIFIMIFSLENYRVHKKRLKQLKFKDKDLDEDEIKELVDKLTKPVIKTVLPKIKIKNKIEIEKDLKMAEWDEKITVQQFIALKIITRVLGVILFLLFFKASKFLAFLWGGVLFLSVDFLLKNSANNRRDRLMMQFPDFIRITQGYLSAGMPFVKAVEESIKFVGQDWQPILQRFVVEAELSDINTALNGIREEVDVFEVKEFLSLVNLTLEQGGDAKEGFEAQAEKVQQMLYDVMLAKIQKRKIIGIFVQFPLLLCNLAVFGLPTLDAMLNLNAM